ncbi:cation:proton antiporter [Candidatus Woesearchaeota archaeon]|nr:MAG: cation:proton antiporter [Candidatus Woesearchaeota archaeon]
MDPIFLVTICLILSLILAEVFNFFKSSIVIGMILAGVLLTIPQIHVAVITEQGLSFIDFLSSLGIIFLLFITGLQVDYEKLKESRKEEGLIAFFSAVVPFALGFIVSWLLGFELITCFVVGAALALTSEGTTIVVLNEVKKLRSKVGTIILGAGILDDVFEILFLSILVIIVQKGISSELAAFPFKIVVFVMVVFIIFKLILPRLISHALKNDSKISSLGLVIVMCFFIASISTFLGFGPIIGAFIAGLILQLLIHKHTIKHKIIDEIQNFSFALIIPFFFINIGLHLDLSILQTNLWLVLIILAVAIAGKIIGALIVRPWSSLTTRQLYLVGWGMNSRGAVELVIAEVARTAGLISIEIYSVLVLMAVVTTFIFPFVLKLYIRKYPGIMDA